MAYSYESVSNVLDFSVGFKPDGAFPLDVRTMFGSKTAAEEAALKAKPAGSTESIYYYGMSLTVVENDVVTEYVILPDNTLEEKGSKIAADGMSIELSNTSLKLKDFGVKYYAYHEADEVIEGTYASVSELPTLAKVAYYKIGDVWYVNTPGTGWAEAAAEPNIQSYYTLTTGWAEGLEPKVRLNSETGNYEISWYEPSKTTVEGLSSIVSTVQSSTTQNTQDITNLNKNLADEISRATTAEGELSDRIQAIEDADTVDSVTADANGTILVDGESVQVYTLPAATTTTLGGVIPDGTSIAVTDKGEISVQAVDHSKVTGLQDQITNATNITLTEAKDYTDDYAVMKTDIATSENVNTDEASASDAKVMSEKAILAMLTWKTTM